MILPSMTYSDVIGQMKSEQDSVSRSLEHYCGIFARDVKRRSEFPFRKTYSFRTPRFKNEYHVTFRAFRRSEWKRPSYIAVMIYSLENGYYAVNVPTVVNISGAGRQNLCRNYNIYVPHFWSRYRERMNVNDGVSIRDMILEFFERNSSAVGREITEDFCRLYRKYEEDELGGSSLVRSEEGVSIVRTPDAHTLIYKTFLTDGMLREGQAENIKDMNTEYRKISGVNTLDELCDAINRRVIL